VLRHGCCNVLVVVVNGHGHVTIETAVKIMF